MMKKKNFEIKKKIKKIYNVVVAITPLTYYQYQS